MPAVREQLAALAFDIPLEEVGPVNNTYEEALQTDWPSEIAPLILRHREDEARHLAYIEMAIAQLAEDAAAAKPAT